MRGSVKMVMCDPPYVDIPLQTREAKKIFGNGLAALVADGGVVAICCNHKGSMFWTELLLKYTRQSFQVDERSPIVIVRSRDKVFKAPRRGLKNVVEYCVVAYRKPRNKKRSRGKGKGSHHSTYVTIKGSDVTAVYGPAASGGWSHNAWLDYLPPHKTWRLKDEQGRPVRKCAEKSVDFLIKMILCFTKPHDLVLDPFAGTCTTGVAALAVNRRFVGCEPAVDSDDK